MHLVNIEFPQKNMGYEIKKAGLSDSTTKLCIIYFALKNLVLWARSEAYGSAEIN